MPDLEKEFEEAEALIEKRRQELARYLSPEERARRREARAAIMARMWIEGHTPRLAIHGTIEEIRAYAAKTSEDWLFSGDRLAEDGLAVAKNGGYVALRPAPKSPSEAP